MADQSTDLIKGSIYKSILWFSIPLLIGNLFQQLYNTVDSYVVGNYVNSNALAAVGASTPVINMLVGFFMGLATGAGVVISQYFGARRIEKMQRAVHSSLALTGVLCVVFTVVGLLCTQPLLKAIGVPQEVLPHSSMYLMIYFCGISFGLVYNMGSGILRAIGDSKRPLIYLIVASVVNIALDFLFVCSFNWGIAGVGIATVIAHAISAVMVMYQLIHTKEDYRVQINEISFDKHIVRKIVQVGFPAAFQQSLTSFSNVIVQSYINSFGTAAMAGYSSTIRIDGFLQLPLQSFNMAITTFVGQNMGAKQYQRVRQGVKAAWLMCSIVILAGSITMGLFGSELVGIFTNDKAVIAAGVTMINVFAPCYIILPIVQILNGTLRGAGLSKVPMYFMVGSFVILRQIYLMITVPLTHNLAFVFAGWPVTWAICAIGLLIYYRRVNWLPDE